MQHANSAVASFPFERDSAWKLAHSGTFLHSLGHICSDLVEVLRAKIMGIHSEIHRK
jgi:hypothetical protein